MASTSVYSPASMGKTHHHPNQAPQNNPHPLLQQKTSSNRPPLSSSIDPPIDMPQSVTLTSQDLFSAFSMSGLASVEDEVNEQVQNMQSQNPTIYTNYRYLLQQHGLLSLHFTNQQKKMSCLNDCDHLQRTFWWKSLLQNFDRKWLCLFLSLQGVWHITGWSTWSRELSFHQLRFWYLNNCCLFCQTFKKHIWNFNHYTT